MNIWQARYESLQRLMAMRRDAEEIIEQTEKIVRLAIDLGAKTNLSTDHVLCLIFSVLDTLLSDLKKKEYFKEKCQCSEPEHNSPPYGDICVACGRPIR